jgi:hypothetical protein
MELGFTGQLNAVRGEAAAVPAKQWQTPRVKRLSAGQAETNIENSGGDAGNKLS